MKTNLIAICAGHVHSDVSRLDWLSALITDYDENRPGVDRQAEDTMLAECTALLNELRAMTTTQAARTMGRVRSERKAQAARKNGAEGGRPKGTPQSEETKAKIRAAWARKREEQAEKERQEG